MTSVHKEPGVINIVDLLKNWPMTPVPRHLIPQQAHAHAVEFKKQSGASPDAIVELISKYNVDGDLDQYFEGRLTDLVLQDERSPE